VTESTAPSPTAPARIVVGVDGSAPSVGALREGARLAVALGLPLEAVTAWHMPDLYGGYQGEAFVPDGRDLVRAAETGQGEAVAAVFGDDVPDWFHGAIREGRSAQTLIEASRGATMLVVGSRGRGGFAGLLLGSVSLTCTAHALCPVLVCRDVTAPAAS